MTEKEFWMQVYIESLKILLIKNTLSKHEMYAIAREVASASLVKLQSEFGKETTTWEE